MFKVSYLIAELMLLDSWSMNLSFRSCIASYIGVHRQKFSSPCLCMVLNLHIIHIFVLSFRV